MSNRLQLDFQTVVIIVFTLLFAVGVARSFLTGE